ADFKPIRSGQVHTLSSIEQEDSTFRCSLPLCQSENLDSNRITHLPFDAALSNRARYGKVGSRAGNRHLKRSSRRKGFHRSDARSVLTRERQQKGLLTRDG